MSDLFVTGIGSLTTNDGDPVSGAVVSVVDGVVSYAGPASDAPEQGEAPLLECEGRAVIPGFVDSHTHLVFAGDRAGEFALKMAGVDYGDLARRGGGIVSTVAATRAAGEEKLFEEAAARLWRMIDGGTTTVEIKSGYGLDLDTELSLLRVARRLGDEFPVTVKTTFLGAHALPPEYRDDRAGFRRSERREGAGSQVAGDLPQVDVAACRRADRPARLNQQCASAGANVAAGR